MVCHTLVLRANAASLIHSINIDVALKNLIGPNLLHPKTSCVSLKSVLNCLEN